MEQFWPITLLQTRPSLPTQEVTEEHRARLPDLSALQFPASRARVLPWNLEHGIPQEDRHNVALSQLPMIGLATHGCILRERSLHCFTLGDISK